MKKIFLLTACLITCLGLYAQDTKVSIPRAVASSSQTNHDASMVVDGRTDTHWHSNWSTIPDFPVVLTLKLSKAEHVDYVRYIPRQDGSINGHWKEVTVSYCSTTNGSTFTKVGDYNLNGEGSSFNFDLSKVDVCGQIKFTIYPGASDNGQNLASAAELEAYTYNTTKPTAFATYFEDNLYTELKSGVTSSEGIADADVKALVASILENADAYKKFRVGEYEPYMTTSTLKNTLKTSAQYNNYENPTGIYLKSGESCYVVVSGIGSSPVGLKIKDWYKSGDVSSYPLHNGLNHITATTEGNVFVNYYTDDFENADNVKVHFINAPVLGYWDQATMKNADWENMLNGTLAADDVILIARSEHAQVAYPIGQWKKHCPSDIETTMTLYQQVQWAQRDILGLEKFDRQVKNRQLFYADKSGSMYAGGDAGVCGYNDLKAIIVPNAAEFDFWGIGHEWGHNNQIAGFKWTGCGETTNNIYASWAQIHSTPNKLRLEDEVTGIDEYKDMRGGRMQAYFEEGIRKGNAWQLQEGPDYYKETPTEVTVTGRDENGTDKGQVATTWRHYDHFVKLAPFWQLNLWGTLAEKCPDIIPMVIESIRTTENYTTTYNTNGKQQINWMKLACDKSGLNLLPFFEKAGMLRPINAYVDDYAKDWNIITEAMINELKAYVDGKKYSAVTEEINYINGHNYLTYKEKKALSVPETMGEGCEQSGIFVKVQHSVVQNAVAFETYNDNRELVRITMYGLGSDDAHSFTQVLFPSEGDYIQAVGYDGTRKTIYNRSSIVWSLNDLSNNKCYTVATKDRGAWYSEDNQLTSTDKIADVNYNEEDANQQFAFLKSEKGNYYLYSVGKEKFVQVSEPDANNKTYTTLSDEPKHAVTFHSSTGGDKTDYPWVVALDGKHVGISNGYTPGVITFYNDLADGGNMVSIKAAASFDPTDAFAKIKAYEESAKFNELQALISKYEEEVSKANTGVGRLTNSAATTISAAIAEAKKITGANSDEEIESAIETLNSTFENVEIVLPSEGKFYVIKSAKYANGLVYANEENRIYWSTEKTSANSETIWKFESNGDGTFKLYNVYNGQYISELGWLVASSLGSETNCNFAFYYQGNGVVFIKGNENEMHAQGSGNGGELVRYNTHVFGSASSWIVEEVEEDAYPKYTLTVSAARWSSLVLGFNATIPSGVTAYVVSSYVVPETIAGEATITPISGNVLPANTPVLINAAEGNYDFAYTTATTTVGNNLLEGKPYNTYLTTVAGTTNYVLSYEGENVSTIGLYKKTVYDADRSDDDEEKDDEGKVITPVNDHIAFFANKAYLPVTTSNGAAPMLRITRGDDATGIQDAELTIDNGQLTIYDITGRRVEKMEKGIYIVNGRKVVVK